MHILIHHLFIIGVILRYVYADPQQSDIICPVNQSCTVDCANHTVNRIPVHSSFDCAGATVKGYNAFNLHILCNNGAFGCDRINVECPKKDDWEPRYNFCRMDCMSDYGCNEVQMLYPNSDVITINCMNGNRTCNRMRIINNKQNEIHISCNTTVINEAICDSLDIMIINANMLQLDCHQKGICNNISIRSNDTSPISIAISVFDHGQLINSKLEAMHTIHNLSLHADTYGMIKDNIFHLNAVETIVAMDLYEDAQFIHNDIEVNIVPNISIISDSKSVFMHNDIYAHTIKNGINIRNIIISHSNIHTDIVPITNVYNSVLINTSHLNVSNTAILNIKHCQIASYSLIEAQHTHATNVMNGSFINNSILNVSHNANVNITNVSLHNTSQIIATYVANKIIVNVGVNTVLNGYSIIDAKYAANFSLICNGLCDEHLSIYTPNVSSKAYIICIAYGCKSLDLYTFNNSDDISFTALQCPCNDDVTTACIESWDIHCAFDPDTKLYLHESRFNSATQCIGDDGVCCGNILNTMHESQCKWPRNHYDCAPGTSCVIDCSNISNTNNVNVYHNFTCNTHQSIINATQSSSLIVLCHTGDASCTNLTVLCPVQQHSVCNITCDGNNGCNLLKIHMESTPRFALQCIADKTCTDVIITNGMHVLNSAADINIYCSHNGCSHIKMNEMAQANVNIDCNDGICNELWIDCAFCNDFRFHCASDAWCTNSILRATECAHFELKCSSKDTQNTQSGCSNITAYIPPGNNSDIVCDRYGCNQLTIYSLSSKTVTDAIRLNVTNCPCSQDVDNLCINKWNLFCNENTNTASVFSDGICNGDCCGDIVDAFHEPLCSPFKCAVLYDDVCIVNCTDLATYEYICHNEVITATKDTTSLNVYCADDIDCHDMEIHCPVLDEFFDGECNIYCQGSVNCQNMTINTNGINRFTFICDGLCQDININNDYNDDSAVNEIAIYCNSGECTNFNIYNLGHSAMDIICNEHCIYDGLTVNGSQLAQLNVFGSNVMIINSIFNVDYVGFVSIEASQIANNTMHANNVGSFNISSSKSFKDNMIYSSQCILQNIHLLNCNASSNSIYAPHVNSFFIEMVCFDKKCLFSNHTLYVDSVQQFKLNATSMVMNSNTIYANYIKNAVLSLHNVSFTDNILEVNYAHFVNITGGFEGNILARNASELYMNIAETSVIHNHSLYIDGYNISRLHIINYGSIYGVHIIATSSKHIAITNHHSMHHMTVNAENSTYISVQCMDKTWCDVLLNVNYSSSVHCYVADVMSDAFSKLIINGNNAQNVFINISHDAHITNNFVLNTNNASLLNMNINGILSNNNNINTRNVTWFILNGTGTINQSVIHCDLCNIFDITLWSVLNNTIYMNQGRILNILNTKSWTQNIVNGNSLFLFNISKNINVSHNQLYTVSVQTLTVYIEDKALFSHNMLYSNSTESINVLNYGNLSGNSIYGNDIVTSFNLSCFGLSSICGYRDSLFLQNARNINIEIGAYANMFNINADNATSVVINVFGTLRNSWINGANCKYLWMECRANNTNSGCHNVSIVSSPIINGQASSNLKCTTYGCQDLNLFTRNDANDFNITAHECPCKDDVVDLCIHKWQIHCKNDTDGVSILSGLHNCTGSCCGHIEKTLEERECISKQPQKHKSKAWIVYVIIAVVVALVIIVPAIYVVRKRKKYKKALNHGYNAIE